MNRRELLPLLVVGAAVSSCAVQEPQTVIVEQPEEQMCNLHGLVSTAKMVQLPIASPSGLHEFYAPELFRVGKSGWICLHCVGSDLADISSVRLTPKGGRDRV